MICPKILWGIFWCVFYKHLLNTVAMVTTFYQDTFQLFIILILCVKNAMQTIFLLITLAKTKGTMDFYNCFKLHSFSSTKQ